MSRLLLPALLLGWLGGDAAAAEKLVLWHSYRGAERTALEKVVAAWNAKGPAAQIDALAVPYDAFADRITAAVPRGRNN